MSKNRTTQHRAQSEEKIKNKKLAEAKRELQEMKKQIGKLQKQLKRALDAGVFKDEDPVSLAEREGALKAAVIKCAACGNENILQAQLPTGIMYACKNCGEKWKAQ